VKPYLLIQIGNPDAGSYTSKSLFDYILQICIIVYYNDICIDYRNSLNQITDFKKKKKKKKELTCWPELFHFKCERFHVVSMSQEEEAHLSKYNVAVINRQFC
jgi:hypothetical protein